MAALRCGQPFAWLLGRQGVSWSDVCAKNSCVGAHVSGWIDSLTSVDGSCPQIEGGVVYRASIYAWLREVVLEPSLRVNVVGKLLSDG